MSSAREGDSPAPAGARGAGRGRRPRRRSAASTARGIARSVWLRRLLIFLTLDLGIACALAGSFAAQCAQQAREAAGQPVARVVVVGGADAPEAGAAASLRGLACQALSPEGDVLGTYPLDPLYAYAAPVLGTALALEALFLLTGAFGTRRIRRKLRPLNELALTAEALGSAADARAGQLESLQRAIASASVEAPRVSTGDEDLRSIEAALNGLLLRMQEAKLQQMRFVDDVSHELRTPIAVIDGYVAMLDRWGKTDPEVLDEAIEALKGESAHMRELVEQLLFLARGDAGRTALDREPLDLAGLAREVAQESQMIDPGHRYLLDLPADETGEAPACPMVGDVALVKQSMRIIVQNAAKYSAPGTRIRLSARTLPAAREAAYVVQDEGAGMSAEDERRAFDRFWRSDEARGGGADGSGLGLSIAKWIVDAHGGRIDVLSVQGVGTRFTVRFPAG